MITKSLLPDQARISSVTLVFRPINVLSCLSRVIEKIIFQQMGTYFENIFSPYLSDFRKRYGCQHVLVQMTEKWHTTLNDKKVIAASSTNLSSAFDSFPHDILIADR